MLNLAQQLVFERAKRPALAGEAANANWKAEGANPLCGDEISLTARLAEDGTVEEIRHRTRACAICAASTDMICEEITGGILSQISEFDAEKMQAMLDLQLSPTRLKCALLASETIKQRLEQA